MVSKNGPQEEPEQELACTFGIDEHGLPFIECPDEEQQNRAFQAIQEYPDRLTVRKVQPKLEGNKPSS